MSNNLLKYVEKMRKSGLSDEQIEKVLIEDGWQKGEITGVWDALGSPLVPQEKEGVSVKHYKRRRLFRGPITALAVFIFLLTAVFYPILPSLAYCAFEGCELFRDIVFHPITIVLELIEGLK